MIWPLMPGGAGRARTMTRQPLRGRPSGAGGRRSGDRVTPGAIVCPSPPMAPARARCGAAWGRRGWQEIGRPRYPGAKSLTIAADGGGSNGVRVRLWTRELQRLADESGLAITVHHLPPGPSKWNAIEHRLFAFISQNWRATPLVSYRVDRGSDRRNHHQDGPERAVRA